MSLPAWESLSDEDKAFFVEAAVSSNAFMRSLWTGLEQQSREQARAAGNIIIADFDRKPFEDAMTVIYDKAATDADTQQLIGRIRQVK